MIVFDKIAILFSERALNCPIHCVLINSPSIFVWNDPWLVQVAQNFFHTLIVVHGVHCSEKHRLSVPFETSSSWDQSTSDCRMHFTYIPDVVDVLSEVLRQQSLSFTAGSTRLPPECPWTALKYRKCLEELGFKPILEPFLWSSSICQERYPIVTWPLRSTIELCLEFFHNLVKSHCSIIFSRNWLITSQ